MARWAAIAVVLVALLGAGSAARSHGAGPQQGLSEAQKAAGFTFDPSVDPASRAAIEQAVAGARPEAQRLIALVDGVTVLRIGDPGGDALGTTQGMGDHFDVVLNLGATQRTVGQAGIARLVLHELGHVVDFALVPEALRAQLDAEIPAGAPCPEGTSIASCAPSEERFAETFAKWAMGNDLGANLYIGYGVPPPSIGFDAWAAPLIGLGH